MLPQEFYKQIAKRINNSLTDYLKDDETSDIPIIEEYEISDKITLRMRGSAVVYVNVDSDEYDERGAYMFSGAVEFSDINVICIDELELATEDYVIKIDEDEFDNDTLDRAIRWRGEFSKQLHIA